MSLSYVRFFEEAGGVESIGGKGASLVDLKGAGFPVPDGFCVTVDGYRYFIESGGLAAAVSDAAGHGDLRDLRQAQGISTGLRNTLLSVPLPADLSAAVTGAYRELAARVGRPPVVAVRSSSVSEDGRMASFAGLYETHLNLRSEDEVLDAVRLCFASLWTARALQYRAVKGLNGAHEAMAVVVMEMVPSKVAGIAFTVNPVTGDRDQVVINASWGLGEAVVSGRVTPDSFVVDRSTLAVVSREVYDKHLAVLPDPSGASGTVDRALDPAMASAPCLSDAEVQEVARLALKVEEHYGHPQDVEWAHTGHALYLLQSRPVTTAT